MFHVFRSTPRVLVFPRVIYASIDRQYSAGSGERKIPCKFEAVRLKSRSLIKLQGPDTLPLLQGLITNDISHLETRPSIYALFLNNQGRVLWDALLFNVGEGSDAQTFLECDSSIKTNLIKHLKVFRLRKKVDIIDVGEVKDNSIDLWVVFDHGHT